MNTGCTEAAFLANFATKDPGTQTMWASMMRVPNAILHAATGIPEKTFSELKEDYPLVTAPGTGGEECLARCGLNFKDVRLHTLVSSKYSHMRRRSGLPHTIRRIAEKWFQHLKTILLVL